MKVFYTTITFDSHKLSNIADDWCGSIPNSYLVKNINKKEIIVGNTIVLPYATIKINKITDRINPTLQFSISN